MTMVLVTLPCVLFDLIDIYEICLKEIFLLLALLFPHLVQSEIKCSSVLSLLLQRLLPLLRGGGGDFQIIFLLPLQASFVSGCAVSWWRTCGCHGGAKVRRISLSSNTLNDLDSRMIEKKVKKIELSQGGWHKPFTESIRKGGTPVPLFFIYGFMSVDGFRKKIFATLRCLLLTDFKLS